MSKNRIHLSLCTLSLVCLAWGCATGPLLAADVPSLRPPAPVTPATPTVTTTTAAAPAPTPPPPRFRTFADFATTPAQLGIALQLDAMGKNPGSDLAGVLDTLSHLPAGQVGPALTQLSPAGYDADTAAAMGAAAWWVLNMLGLS